MNALRWSLALTPDELMIPDDSIFSGSFTTLSLTATIHDTPGLLFAPSDPIWNMLLYTNDVTQQPVAQRTA